MSNDIFHQALRTAERRPKIGLMNMHHKTFTPHHLVEKFHQKYKLPLNQGLTLGELRICKKLIMEEYKEVIQAIEVLEYELTTDTRGPDSKVAPAALLKELCDLQYVCGRPAVVFGWDMEGGMEAVHLSNMTKTGGIDGGKLTKGKGYIAADLRNFV
ncbi:MAG: hypothetical protein EBR82_51390 [Caulobacteraceae bacterium]|nr:hypothetical protein [Caulobacteraceae bacterium]